jgi:hypothetical protein
MLKILRTLLFLPALILVSCSTSEQISEEEEDQSEDIYVFDEPAPGSEFDYDGSVTSSPVTKSQYYVVQIGAFTTLDKAEQFAAFSENRVKHKLNIHHNEEINLFVVQISSEYTEKREAEKLRDELWKMKEFKDAWVQSVFK